MTEYPRCFHLCTDVINSIQDTFPSIVTVVR